MEDLLTRFLDEKVIQKEKTIIKVSSYNMNYSEYEFSQGKVLVYRSYNNPIMIKLIIITKKNEYNYTLPKSDIDISFFLDFYRNLSLKNELTIKQLSFSLEHLENISFKIKEYAKFYKTEYPGNVQILNVLPQELSQAIRDYRLLMEIIKLKPQPEILKIHLDLNISVQPEFEYLIKLANSHKMRI